MRSVNTDARKAVAVMSDLFFAVKVNEAAKRGGYVFKMAKTEEAALNNIRDGAEIVILDLNCREVDPIALLKTIKADDSLKHIRTVAFLSHVHEDLRRAAVEAGCDEVMPRSRFVTVVDSLFTAPALGV